MLCSEFAFAASLLSTALQLDCTFNGTHSVQNTPALYYHDIGTGTIDITLPAELGMSSFLWNATYQNGSLVYDENSTIQINTTLQDYAFRLHIFKPSRIGVTLDYENATMHDGILPLNLTWNHNTYNVTPGGHVFYKNRYNSDGVYMDFFINATEEITDNISISLPFEWWFQEQDPGFFHQPIVAWLAPFDWSHVNTVSNSSFVYDQYNLTNSTDQFGFLEPTIVDLMAVTLDDTMQCIDINSTYGYFEEYGGLLNCSQCAVPTDQFTIHEYTDFTVVQSGAAIACSSSISPAQATYIAGDEIVFEFELWLTSDSFEDGRDLDLTLNTGAHVELTSLTAGNTSILNEPASGGLYQQTEPNILISDGGRLTISGNGTIRDSIPLDDLFYQYITYSWTYDSVSAQGLSLSSSCYEGIRSPALDLGSVNATINIPATWTDGEITPLQLSFEIPPGTVDDVSVDIDINYDTSLGGIEIVSASVEADRAGVLLPEATYSRKKRAVTSNNQNINIGTIVNPASSGGTAVITLNAQLAPSLSTSTMNVAGGSVNLNIASQVVNVATIGTAVAYYPDPHLVLTKRTKYGSTERGSLMVELTVNHTSNSNDSAYKVTLIDNEQGFSLDLSSFDVSPSTIVDITPTGDGSMKVFVSELNISTPIVISYELTAMGDEDFPDGETTNTAQIQYYNTATATQVHGTETAVSCTERVDVESESIIYQHGITALAVIIGFVLGIVLVPLIIFIIVVILKKTRGGYGVSVRPSATDYRSISKQKNNNALLLDAGQRLKEGFTSAMTSVGDSIVALLALRDRFTTNRELDSLDIQATVEVDKKMESERLVAIDGLMDSLLLSMVKNGDITRQQYDVTILQFKKSQKDLNIRLDVEYKAAIDEFSQRQAMQNRKKLGDLIDKQRTDKIEQLEKVDDISDADKAELVKNIETQCQIEQDDLSYRLKLQQDEEAEKLRKEFSLKKRIQTKELQQAALNDVKEKTKMPEEQAAWLMKEHAKNVSALDKIHDEELSRQRLVLEEKLAQRRALAELSDTQEKGQSELLNTIAGGQMDVLKKAKKQKVITAEEAREKSDDIMNDLVAYKQSMEQDMAKKETALHNKLSEDKKKQLSAKAKEQQSEMADFEKRAKQQQAAGTVDPLSIATERIKLVADHEIARASKEIEIDKQNSAELKDMREQMTNTYKTTLMDREKKLLDELKTEGLRDEQVDAIISEHNNNVESLQARQSQQYDQQDEKLKMRLKKRRRDWEKRMQQEQEEKAQLREQEATVVNQIVDSQLTMSEDEREKIMREHEANMVRLENSMTLNKLRQRQILEEKLAERRAKKMQQLEQEQLAQAKKTEKRHANEDEDDQQAATVELLKTQAEERVAALTEEDDEVNFDEELEKVKLEMMQERAIALREQEDRLGSMVAQLQINKAKELTEIDDKQRAINELKANLIDDLNERGVMSDIEAEQCLEKHRAQQDKLTRKLNDERDKQEKMLKKKLAMRLESREKTLLDGYEDRLKEALSKSPNKIAGKLRKAAILHKRAQAIEDFKSRMEKEISQSLEELKREQSMKKAKLSQELELRFIASLVQQGKLKRSELKECLKLLFPAKNDKDIEILINTLHDPEENVSEDEQDLLNASSSSMLKERIARSVSLYQGSLGTIDEEAGGKRGRPKSSRKKQASPLDMDYYPDSEGHQRLPPLKPLSAKKRRPKPNSEDYY